MYTEKRLPDELWVYPSQGLTMSWSIFKKVHTAERQPDEYHGWSISSIVYTAEMLPNES